MRSDLTATTCGIRPDTPAIIPKPSACDAASSVECGSRLITSTRDITAVVTAIQVQA